MKKENIYLSTIAPDAAPLAREYGFGLEIAEYCTAWNMDEKFNGVDGVVKKKLEGTSRSTLHAPYNELFPCAIDKKARALATERYRQAIDLAKRYGSKKVIIHGGYNPWIYYPVWYVEQSILFWKDFLKEDPGVEIVLENVLETEPQWLLDIVKGVADSRLKLCLDVGHVNAYSKIPVTEWLSLCLCLLRLQNLKRLICLIPQNVVRADLVQQAGKGYEEDNTCLSIPKASGTNRQTYP